MKRKWQANADAQKLTRRAVMVILHCLQLICLCAVRSGPAASRRMRARLCVQGAGGANRRKGSVQRRCRVFPGLIKYLPVVRARRQGLQLTR